MIVDGKRIIKVGLDVHSTSFTATALELDGRGGYKILLQQRSMQPTGGDVVKFIKDLKNRYSLNDANCDIECAYESGCLGYSLYNDLTSRKVKCVMLAPSTMTRSKGKRVKTDLRDSVAIALDLANGTAETVYVLDEEDEDNRDFIRDRAALVDDIKRLKQRINSKAMTKGYTWTKTKWTKEHVEWLSTLDLKRRDRISMNDMLSRLDEAQAHLKLYDDEIAESAKEERYQEPVKKLSCFIGITEQQAMTLVTETGDFNRFPTAAAYSSYVGLTPGEYSSGNDINHLGITKAGNSRIRTTLILAAQSIARGSIGYKSRALRARQEGNPPEVIAYADKANVRLRKRFFSLSKRKDSRNKAVTAIARELACFVWGMMTGNIGCLKVEQAAS